jgi:poly(glycerol-phosphate) alpha-glucosyltransferase
VWTFNFISKMKILHLISGLSPRAGGIFYASQGLIKGSAELGARSLAVGLEDPAFNATVKMTWEPIPVTGFKPSIFLRPFGFALGLSAHVANVDPDIVHLHGVWMYPSIVASKWRARSHGPLVITPHGMLDPWALKNSALIKRFAYWLYESGNLHSASCLHALCQQEYEDIRGLGLKNPVAIIPNGITLPELPSKGETSPRTLLFLGRLHPKKGIGQLIEAWKLLGAAAQGWQLKVAGWGDQAYMKRIAHQAHGMNISFAGPLYGAEKAKAFAQASAFILPSLSEGLPMAVLEAWSYGLPVIMTRACNLELGFDAQAAIECEAQPEALAQALKKALIMPAPELNEMGQKGRALVAERFRWPTIAGQMNAVYQWLLNAGPKPECVHED